MRGGIWILDGSLRNTKRDVVYFDIIDPSVLWSFGVIVHYSGRNACSSHKLIMDSSFMWKEEALQSKYWLPHMGKLEINVGWKLLSHMGTWWSMCYLVNTTSENISD